MSQAEDAKGTATAATRATGTPVEAAAAAAPERPALPSDPAALEAHIDATRVRLAATVDELGARLQPKALAQHGIQDAQRRARAAVITDDGSLRVERVAAAALAVVAVLALVVRRRRHRR